MTASWHSLAPVERPRVLLGRPGGRMEQTAPARTVSYLDAKSGKTAFAHHAAMTGWPDRFDLRFESPWIAVGGVRSRSGNRAS